MKRYLLDTALVAGYLHGRAKAVDLVTPWIARDQAATSILVYAEVVEYLLGFHTSHFQRYQEALQRLLHAILPYSLTYSILDRYAVLRRRMRQPHGPGLIGDIDTLIAATALEQNLTVVTVDHDFERVPGLKVQLVNLKAV